MSQQWELLEYHQQGGIAYYMGASEPAEDLKRWGEDTLFSALRDILSKGWEPFGVQIVNDMRSDRTENMPTVYFFRRRVKEDRDQDHST